MIEGKIVENSAKLLYGMVGGGPGSFIGPVHRAALAMNGQAKLVAGSFSDVPDETVQTGKELELDPERVYPDYRMMAEMESLREGGIDFVVIAAPNHLHYEIAKAFLEKSINVVCEKPLAFNSVQADHLSKLASENNLEFMVTYTYTGYPMVREARNLVSSGELGEIRVIVAEYAQDWLSEKIEDTGQRQAAWRTNPKYAGISCCVGDIGTHIENLVHFITSLEIKDISANLDTFVKGRVLDDNAFIQIKYNNGASGNYWSSQVAVGHENGLKVRIFGTKASLEWEQENPNSLRLAKKGKPVQTYTRGNGYLSAQAAAYTRLPSGHPEGYFEAFANLYKSFCNTLNIKKNKQNHEYPEFFPTVVDGARGIKFVEDCVKSSKKSGDWVDGSFSLGGGEI